MLVGLSANSICKLWTIDINFYGIQSEMLLTDVFECWRLGFSVCGTSWFWATAFRHWCMGVGILLLFLIYPLVDRCVDEGEDFHCVCEKGYKGVLCELDIDECANHPCYNGGACIDKIAHYECKCPEYASGPNCEHLDTNPGWRWFNAPSNSKLNICFLHSLLFF